MILLVFWREVSTEVGDGRLSVVVQGGQKMGQQWQVWDAGSARLRSVSVEISSGWTGDLPVACRQVTQSSIK